MKLYDDAMAFCSATGTLDVSRLVLAQRSVAMNAFPAPLIVSTATHLRKQMQQPPWTMSS